MNIVDRVRQAAGDYAIGTDEVAISDHISKSKLKVCFWNPPALRLIEIRLLGKRVGEYRRRSRIRRNDRKRDKRPAIQLEKRRYIISNYRRRVEYVEFVDAMIVYSHAIQAICI